VGLRRIASSETSDIQAAVGKQPGDFWTQQRKDVSVVPELVKRFEARLLPAPGTEVLLSKTEFTVGERKLYLLRLVQ
jgi:hypothetical protein